MLMLMLAIAGPPPLIGGRLLTAIAVTAIAALCLCVACAARSVPRRAEAVPPMDAVARPR